MPRSVLDFKYATESFMKRKTIIGELTQPYRDPVLHWNNFDDELFTFTQDFNWIGISLMLSIEK